MPAVISKKVHTRQPNAPPLREQRYPTTKPMTYLDYFILAGRKQMAHPLPNRRRPIYPLQSAL